MTDVLSFDVRPSRTALPAGAQPQLVYVLLQVQPGAGLSAVRLPVNLALVVDRSQSMTIPNLTDEQFRELARKGGVREVLVDGIPVWEFRNVSSGALSKFPSNLDFVILALRSAVERLQAQDRVSLVAFAARTKTLLAAEAGLDRGRLVQAVGQIEQLNLGDETRMAQGMAQGWREASRGMAPDRVSRMILLTDGFAADGQECLHQAQQAAASGLTISTVGLGLDFNEELLIAIADLTKGNAYLVSDPEEIPSVFARELSGVQSVGLRNLEVKLALVGGVELRRVHRVQPVISEMPQVRATGGSASIPLADLEAGEPQALILELVAPPRAPGSYRLAQVVLAYDDPAHGAPGQKERRDLVVQYEETLAPALDAVVMNVVERLSAHILQTRALQDAQAGNVTGATQKLQAAYTRLLGMGESELAEAARQEIDNLQQGGQVSAAGTKRLRYETRRLTGKPE